MKKILAFITGLIVVLSLLSGCGAAEPAGIADTAAAAASETPETLSVSSAPLRIAGLTGPTTMGLVKLMQDAEDGSASGNYEFSLYGTADEVTPKLLKGELDLAAVPANLASVLYNNTEGQIRLVAVNTLGVLYIVENGETVSSLEDLKGQTVYATGKGSTPEYTLRYLLKQHGIDPRRSYSC